MLNTANLSLDQAPPISIPFRFFVTAPLFGIAAALLLLFKGPELFLTRWSPFTLGLTHLITLGFLAMVMCGALLQMLPVIAGSPVPRVVLVGTLCHLMITLGSALLVHAFISGSLVGEHSALALMGGGVIIFFIAISLALWRVENVSHSVIAMRLAVVALMITLLLGLLLGSGLLGFLGFGNIAALVDVHLGWGMLGWVGLLLVGISYQVVPMFQVTPEYPVAVRRWLAPSIFGGMLVWSGFSFMAMQGLVDTRVTSVWMSLILAGFACYAVVTLRLQRLRKRRIPDVTLSFWRVGMVSVLLSALLWGVAQLVPAVEQDPRYHLFLGVALLLGAGVSVINGMLYKIVPFLSWFHLQNRQVSLMCMSVQVPNMKQFIRDRYARMQYRLYLASLVLALASTLQPSWFSYLAGMMFLGSNILLLVNLSLAMTRYRTTNAALLAEGAVEKG
ncbi:MAG: hypothetical protein OQL28_03990 [Sedimenticola sp.]|nr:hypothetical protein [Sedimenticola sp.]